MAVVTAHVVTGECYKKNIGMYIKAYIHTFLLNSLVRQTSREKNSLLTSCKQVNNSTVDQSGRNHAWSNAIEAFTAALQQLN